MKNIILIISLMILSQNITSRSDPCSSMPKDTKSFAKCCVDNPSHSYCKIKRSRKMMRAMRQGPPSGIKAMRGQKSRKRITMRSITKLSHTNSFCYYSCLFDYIMGYIDWWEYLECLCDCYHWDPWWCWWFP